MALVGIILGSDSDLPKIQDCFGILEDFGVDFEIIVSSAHRSPDATREWASTARDRGIRLIIAAAGGAAHLPGVVAAHTTLPVIGIPIETQVAGGLDSILSIIQMPSGVPVAAMPAGKSGGSNAALFALEILSLADPSIEKKLSDFRKNVSEKIKSRNQKLNASGYKQYIKDLEKQK
ncbi:MAG: 5-(carboxyamino)imidazole ribonucleotide mutase [Spirochaetes bacterium]|jgi:phosphoribosylaminoimidazole carboxylase PurE protein|nr:5-(carboxyamino)imidazole ribonucleotide mutase [Spirochaetota bacterium]